MASEHNKFHVESTVPPIWEQEQSFQEIMADQLRHAPWLMLSIVIHGLVGLIFYLMPSSSTVEEEKVVEIKPPEQVEVPEEEPEPEPEPEPEETEEEPVLQDTEVTEVAEQSENFEEFSDTNFKESAFDSNQWNAAVGLGGGAGGKYGGRGGGRGGLGGRGGKATARAIELALEWLKKHQDDDGRWDADEFMKHDVDGEPCDGPGNPVHDVGLTGLALLAFLGDGSTMRSGPYQDVVKKGVRWLRNQQDMETGLFGTNNSHEFIYNHAIAAFAMVEAYGLSDYNLLKKNAEKALGYLEYHRNPYSVWRYQPQDGENDTSVSGWAILAYKSASDFGIDVNKQTFKLMQAWLDQMTDPVSGRTGYLERGGWSSRRQGDHAVRFPRENGECMTAVSLLVRFFLGNTPDDDKMMATQADLIAKQLPKWEDGYIDHYYWYYGTYALYQFGGRQWNTWENSLTSAVVKKQREDGNYLGSWDPVGVWGDDGGRVYSTALLCLTLEAYYRYSRIVR